METFTYIINKLPYDIKFYIYKNFIEPNLFYDKYKKLIAEKESSQLNISKIRPELPLLLKNELIINNLRKKCKIFDVVYSKHKITNEKNFILLNQGNSFCLALLYYFYH